MVSERAELSLMSIKDLVVEEQGSVCLRSVSEFLCDYMNGEPHATRERRNPVPELRSIKPLQQVFHLTSSHDT